MSSEVFDFRSDTVTVPTAAMRNAMFGARVGDSVYGEDPEENELQRIVAQLCGKEDALFVCSGTMGNQIALRVHTHFSKQAVFPSVVFDKEAHAGYEELGGAVVNARVMPVFVHRAPDTKYMTAEHVRAALVKDHDLHRTTTIGVCVENTWHGIVTPIEEFRKIGQLAKENELFVHLDGARIWNASVATGVSLKEWCSHVDSASLCFSKGLGAPIGSVLVGSSKFIEAAKEVRKAFGGGWRQCGFLASACLYALSNNVDRLREDHENATALWEGLVSLGFECDKPDTNIVFAKIPPKINVSWNEQCVPLLKKHDVIVATYDASSGVRLVTHMQTPKVAITKLIQTLKKVIV